MKKKNPNREEIFKKRISIFFKILVALLFLAIFPISLGVFLTILSYRDFIFKSLLPDLPPERIQEVLALEQNIEIQAGLILFLSGIFALFLGILISRHFSRALERISDGLKRVLAGNLDFRINITSSDEIGEASYFFNRMIKNLKESQIMLAAREKELQEKTLELAEKVKTLEISGQEAERTKLATLNILEDVGEARGELEKEKERIETIILSLADGLLVLSDNKILLLNPAAEGIFGVKKEEIIGKSLDFLRHPNLKIFSKFLKENTKRPIFRQEIVFEKPGRTFQISILLIAGGQDLVILHDVTREKLIDQMKTEFVSLAAHQLRTPLSAIKWTLKLILDGDLGKITREQKDFLQKTYLSNERMIDLINDLLNVARIEEGRYLYRLLPSQIEDTIKNIMNSYLPEIERKKIKFQFQKPKEKLPKINLDEEKITLAIQNLIDNAIRYTPPGGQVTVSLRRANMEIEFSVKDTGVGIPKDQQERVFSKFFRAANVMRIETEGAGLGLFITKNIIEAHGGKIWFESEENKGTTFYFTLPIKKGVE